MRCELFKSPYFGKLMLAEALNVQLYSSIRMLIFEILMLLQHLHFFLPVVLWVHFLNPNHLYSFDLNQNYLIEGHAGWLTREIALVTQLKVYG
jgi:hypothetical protein